MSQYTPPDANANGDIREKADGGKPSASKTSDAHNNYTAESTERKEFPPIFTGREFMTKTFAQDDVCDDCGKPIECECDPDYPCECGKGCTCDENDWDAEQRYFTEVSERIRSGFSVCNDGDATWARMKFSPIQEPGKPQDERRRSYFGGYTFRHTGTTQMIRAISEVTGAPEPLCAMVAPHTISSALGKGLRVSFRRGEETPLGLYLLALVPSGIGKSLVGKYLASPLTDAHGERQAEWRKTVRPKLEVKKRLLTAKLKTFEKEYQDSDQKIFFWKSLKCNRTWRKSKPVCICRTFTWTTRRQSASVPCYHPAVNRCPIIQATLSLRSRTCLADITKTRRLTTGYY
jgi:hypothetical protein